MRERKWTQGEWWLSGLEIVVMPLQVKICNMVGGLDRAEAKANAALISAAPELVLEVEKSCIRCSWQDDFIGSDIANCPQVKTCGKAKALAKAYGET